MKRALSDLIERDGVKLNAFVSCEPDESFQATVLAVAKDSRGRRIDAAVTFSATSAFLLEADAAKHNLTLGDVDALDRNCRSAKCSPRHMRLPVKR